MKNHSRCRSGFTLIELLVVAAIIIMLAALSFVFVRRGRDAADEVRCMNNIKVICADQLAMAAENNGFILHPWRSAPLGGWARNWAMHHTILKSEDMGWREQTDKVVERMRTMDHFQCPTAYRVRREEMADAGGHNGWRTYGLNGRIGVDREPSASERGWIDGAATITQVADPAKLVLVHERQWNGSAYSGAGGPYPPKTVTYADFHRGGFHVGYMDGHVLKWKPNEFLLGGVTLPNGQEGKWSNPEFSLMWRGQMFKRSLPN
jgi:prepilin-type N-terminal cleavage/methylation domain-containing protein